MSNEQYVLEAKETITYPFSDGYYTGKSYIYQGLRYAVINTNVAQAKQGLLKQVKWNLKTMYLKQ